jgi:hypothetical protein
MTREERLELLKQIEKDIHVCSLESTLLDDAKSCAIHSAIEELEQEPRTGKWIEHFDEIGKWYECDQCHTDWGGAVNFCPNCGAKMAEQEGT